MMSAGFNFEAGEEVPQSIAALNAPETDMFSKTQQALGTRKGGEQATPNTISSKGESLAKFAQKQTLHNQSDTADVAPNKAAADFL